MPSLPRGHFDGLGQPSQDLPFARPQGLLHAPHSPERATTSYGYTFPSSSAPERVLHRPATAPITLSQVMPPKRELPFPKQPPNIAEERTAEGGSYVNTDDHINSQTVRKAAKGRRQGKAKDQTSRPSSSRAKPMPVSKEGPATEIPSAPAPEPELRHGTLATSEALLGAGSSRKRIIADHVMTEGVKGMAKAQTSRPSSSRAKTRSAAKQESAKGHPQPLVLGLKPRLVENMEIPDTLMADSSPGKKNAAQEPTEPVAPNFASEDTLVATSSPDKRTAAKRAMAAMTETSPSKTNARKTSSAALEKPPTVPEQFAKDFENVSPEAYMDRLDHWVRKYHDLPAPKPPVKPTSTDKDQLAAYGAQPEETRLAALDNMICDYLGDENFVKLVEDMDKSWRRIGLGF